MFKMLLLGSRASLEIQEIAKCSAHCNHHRLVIFKNLLVPPDLALGAEWLSLSRHCPFLHVVCHIFTMPSQSLLVSSSAIEVNKVRTKYIGER